MTQAEYKEKDGLFVVDPQSVPNLQLPAMSHDLPIHHSWSINMKGINKPICAFEENRNNRKCKDLNHTWTSSSNSHHNPLEHILHTCLCET